MSNSLIETSPASPGGKNLSAEEIAGGGPGGEDVYFERIQTVGALITEIARVMNTAPAAGDYGLVVRALVAQLPAALGQALMAASLPVAIASNQSAITVGAPQLPAVLVGGRLDENLGAWLGSTAPTVGQKTMAASIPVVLPSDQATIPVTTTPSTTCTGTSVAANAASVTLLAANAARKGATIYNDPAGGAGSNMFVKLGTTASATDFIVRLAPNAYYEVPFNYTGRIDAIWTLALGAARIGELT
jgi:hypothetical protein